MDVIRHTADHEDATVVTVVGELDAVSAPALDEALSTALTDAPTCLIVDLGGVDFMDSTGLGILIKAARQAGELGTGFALVVTSPRVRKLLTITGMVGPLAVSDSMTSAMATCGLRP